MAVLSFTGINKSLSTTRRNTSLASKTIKNISNVISTRSVTRKNIGKNILQYKNRREENERRQKNQDEITSTLQVLSPRGAKSLSLSQIGGSFSKRILGFFAFTTAGWLLSNMPTWIGGAKELTLRVQSLDSTFSGFVNDIGNLMNDIGKLSNSFYKNITSFDFSDNSGLVASSMSDLTDTFGNMVDKITEAFDVLTQPFMNVPPLGSEGDEGAYPDVQPPGQPSGQPAVPTGNADFWTLVAVAAREDSDPQGQADVAQSIYNRVAAGVFPGGTDIRQIILANKQYQPTRDYPKQNPSGKTNREWYLINSPETAAKATGYDVNTIKTVAKNITNPSLQKKAAEYIENRTDFVGKGLSPSRDSSTTLRRRTPDDNIFGNFVGPASFEYGRRTMGKPSPVVGQITPPASRQQPPSSTPSRPSGQSGFTSVFNFEVHHPAANEGKRSGLMESVTYQPNEVTRAFIKEFGSYPRGFDNKGGPKRGLNILEVADEKGIDYNAQKIFKIIKQFPNVFFNMFAGHSDVPNLEGMETGAKGKSGIHEQIFNPKVCEKVMELCNSEGLKNIAYRLPLGKPTSGSDPKSNWSYSERLIKEFRPGSSQSSRPTPQPQPQPSQVQLDGRRLRSGDTLTRSLGRNVDFIKITDLVGSPRKHGSHGGIDVAAPNGTYIALRVDAEWVAYDYQREGYGHVLDLWIPSLGIQLRFAHLYRQPDKLSKIPAGRSFAQVGSTGNSSGPHIHFEYDTRKGGTNYGGARDIDPNYAANLDKYVRLLLLSKQPLSAFPRSQVSSQISTPSESILPAPSTTLLQSSEGTATIESNSGSFLDDILKGLSTERRGQQIVLINDLQPPQSPMMISSGGGSQIIISNESNLVNSFIKNKLLLDLNYL